MSYFAAFLHFDVKILVFWVLFTHSSSNSTRSSSVNSRSSENITDLDFVRADVEVVDYLS